MTPESSNGDRIVNYWDLGLKIETEMRRKPLFETAWVAAVSESYKRANGIYPRRDRR